MVCNDYATRTNSGGDTGTVSRNYGHSRPGATFTGSSSSGRGIEAAGRPDGLFHSLRLDTQVAIVLIVFGRLDDVAQIGWATTECH